MRPAKIAGAVALGFMLVLPWGLYLRERSKPAGRPTAAHRPAPSVSPTISPAAVPDASAPDPTDEPSRNTTVRLLGNPLDLEALAMKAAAEEQAMIDEFEAAIAGYETAIKQAELLLNQRLATGVIDLLVPLLDHFPKLELKLLDARDLEYRAALARVKMDLMVKQAKLALLEAQPESDERLQGKIKLGNKVLDLSRRLSELLDGPAPLRRAIAAREAASGPVRSERSDATEKLSTIKIDVQFTNMPLEDVVTYFREFSGMNFVVRGEGTGTIPVTLILRDLSLHSMLDQLSQQTGVPWEINGSGVVVVGALPGAK